MTCIFHFPIMYTLVTHSLVTYDIYQELGKVLRVLNSFFYQCPQHHGVSTVAPSKSPKRKLVKGLALGHTAREW